MKIEIKIIVDRAFGEGITSAKEVVRMLELKGYVRNVDFNNSLIYNRLAVLGRRRKKENS